jgi:hypothetical protein
MSIASAESALSGGSGAAAGEGCRCGAVAAAHTALLAGKKLRAVAEGDAPREGGVDCTRGLDEERSVAAK